MSAKYVGDIVSDNCQPEIIAYFQYFWNLCHNKKNNWCIFKMVPVVILVTICIPLLLKESTQSLDPTYQSVNWSYRTQPMD